MYIVIFLINDIIVSAGVCDSKTVARCDKKDWEKKSELHKCVIHHATRDGKRQTTISS